MKSYYVYALKDTSRNPAVPFYIGKGTGSRATDHLVSIDSTRKGKRIKRLREGGYRILVTILADELTEAQAIRLESELISAFGTEDTGGLLANSVVPTGKAKSRSVPVNVPEGIWEKAQIGLKLLKDSVLELAQANKDGITNSDATKALELHSDYMGGSKDYLTWSILGLLMKEGKMKRVDQKKHVAQV